MYEVCSVDGCESNAVAGQDHVSVTAESSKFDQKLFCKEHLDCKRECVTTVRLSTMHRPVKFEGEK